MPYEILNVYHDGSDGSSCTWIFQASFSHVQHFALIWPCEQITHKITATLEIYRINRTILHDSKFDTLYFMLRWAQNTRFSSYCLSCSISHHVQWMINETEHPPTHEEGLLMFGKHPNDGFSILKTDVGIFNRRYPSQMTTRYSIAQVNTYIAKWNVKHLLF